MHLRWRLSGNTCQRITIRSASGLIFQAEGLKLYTHLSTAHAVIRLNSIYYSESSLLYVRKIPRPCGWTSSQSIHYRNEKQSLFGAKHLHHPMLLKGIEAMNDVSSNSIFYS